MQDNQRFANFLIFSVMILLVWTTFVQPALFPPPPKAPPIVQPDAEESEEEAAEAAGEDAKNAPPGKLHEYPAVDAVKIGSADPQTGYRILATFTSLGGNLSELQLVDRRYRDLENPKQPLSLIKPEPELTVKPLQTNVPALDAQLKKFGKKLQDVHWELVKAESNDSRVTWRYVSPDDSLEVRKTFSLTKVDPAKPELEYQGYGVKYELAFRNLGKADRKLKYTLFGPVGLPIENRYYTQKTRDLALGFMTQEGQLAPKLLTNEELRKSIEAERKEEWKTPLKYAGVDIQYFSALLLPQVDQLKSPYFEGAKAVFVDPAPKNLKADTKYRTATLELKSKELPLAAPGKPEKDKEQVSEVKHEFVLFAGPKRPEFLRPLGAEKVIDYGMVSGRTGIPQFLLGLLSIFQQGLSFLPWPYGWSIILLTVLVRSCMFPLSRKQALTAAKMQELQPELTALKEKYKNTPEKFAKAQMELFSKHKVNPFSGCLPLLIQLPIFFGLYTAFNMSVDMRGAPFLWIDNLAAPDALFKFPWVLPLLGPSFNLLPILTVCLFLAQQKMMMPPATTPEMEMQQKVFFYMTIFMGYMFYGVAAGMCVYFIASSLWGLAERKLLPKSNLVNSSTPPTTLVVKAEKPRK